jgi:hypothetical protein
MNFLNPQEIASVCSKPCKDEPKRQSRRSNPNGTRQSQSPVKKHYIFNTTIIPSNLLDFFFSKDFLL